MSESAPALFRRYPQLAGRIPWLPLGDFPTPVEPLQLDTAPQDSLVWVKRDDLSSSIYGGNKVRKLEFILAEAERQGAERLITVGAAGSHHALATAIYGARLGFHVTLVLYPQVMTPHVREVLLMDVAQGAEIRYAPRMEMIPLAQWLTQMGYREERAYIVCAGGSDALGTLGYVSAALELAEQIEHGEAPVPDVVHVAAGTLGTMAGLAIGFALAGIPARVVGTRIVSRLVAGERVLTRLITATLRKLKTSGVIVPQRAAVRSRVMLEHAHVGTGYGRATPAGDVATQRLAAHGIILDVTYTAKAAAEMLAAIENRNGERHLFWHTLSSARPPAHLPDSLTNKLPEPLQKLLAGM